MEWIFLLMVVFLFVLAVFDLYVGVSNDAVNFMNSAIGSKAARFRTVVIVASVGVLCGAIMSNGMMDIARHGIFRPEMFSFEDVMVIYLAVMVTDIVLLDVFNSLCTEITCPDNNHIMSTVNTKNFTYLIIKILYIISVSLLPKPSKVVQILSYLRCGNLHPCTEFF